MWILMLFVVTLKAGYEDSPTLEKVEYHSKATCDEAGRQNVLEFQTKRVVVKFTCTQK